MSVPIVPPAAVRLAAAAARERSGAAPLASSVSGAIVINPSSASASRCRRCAGPAEPRPPACSRSSASSPATLTCTSTRWRVPPAPPPAAPAPPPARASRSNAPGRSGPGRASPCCAAGGRSGATTTPGSVTWAIFVERLLHAVLPHVGEARGRAAVTASGPNPLVTATMVTGWVQPPAACRRAISARMWASRSGSPAKFIAGYSTPERDPKQSSRANGGRQAPAKRLPPTRVSRRPIAPDSTSRT